MQHASQLATQQSDWLFAAAPSPPPSRWRTKSPKFWGAQNWKQAWKEARDESAADQFLFDSTRLWVKLLTADAESATYWASGKIPQPHALPAANRVEWMACPGKARLHTKLGTSSDTCHSWWPHRRDQPCVAYFIGIGDEWGFARDAVSHGCRVHAYDPTTELRLRHVRSADAITEFHNVSPHFTYRDVR